MCGSADHNTVRPLSIHVFKRNPRDACVIRVITFILTLFSLLYSSQSQRGPVRLTRDRARTSRVEAQHPIGHSTVANSITIGSFALIMSHLHLRLSTTSQAAVGAHTTYVHTLRCYFITPPPHPPPQYHSSPASSSPPSLSSSLSGPLSPFGKGAWKCIVWLFST